MVILNIEDETACMAYRIQDDSLSDKIKIAPRVMVIFTNVRCLTQQSTL